MKLTAFPKYQALYEGLRKSGLLHIRVICKAIIAVFFILSLTACITSELNLREGIASFKAQDYRSAFIRLKPLANDGQPDAMYAVGYMYYYGQGIVEDRQKAWIWINRAAEAGHPDAIEAVQLLGGPPPQKLLKNNIQQTLEKRIITQQNRLK